MCLGMRHVWSEHLLSAVWLTEQLNSSSQAIDIDERPKRFGGAHAAEEQHGTGAVDAVEDAPLLVHPEGHEVALIG